ncbi:MAG: hypothetical protein FJX29_10180, partial [Alphaproteobacteria bacterium]|nr:hypothetical protein [Alphaproteobacteria bacterium]
MSAMAVGPTAAQARGVRRNFSFENIVMGGAILALIFLVVLPVAWLLVGSLRGEGGFNFENFRTAITGRLYRQALFNSLQLGALTGLFSLLIGVPLAFAAARTNVPGKGLFHLTANLSYLSPPFLTAIAFVTLLSPNAGL